MTSAALVLFSGGQDSTICLAWARAKYERVETLGFDYGQRHKVELACRTKILEQMPSAADHLLPLPALAEIGGTALIGEGEIRVEENGLPSSFVAGRNLLFFTYAAALAYRRGINVLVGGMCETDYSGYPDCRRATLDSLADAINLGMESAIEIETPLMEKTKAQSWEMAEQLGGDALVELIIEHTHTCYLGDRSAKHDWGYGCGKCPACNLRREGFREWRKK